MFFLDIETGNYLNIDGEKVFPAAGVGKGGTIAHKTGDIGFLVGDAGIISLPNGKHYLAEIFVIRPHDDERVVKFVRQVSRIVYQYLDQPKLSQKYYFHLT